jgi:RNA recognition motif-containing protein
VNIFVGNLSRDITEEDLQEAFGAFGKIASVAVIKDKFTAEPRGFGFVEMPNKNEAQAAIAALNGKDIKGKPLNVNEARPRAEGGRGGGGGPRHGGRRPF